MSTGPRLNTTTGAAHAQLLSVGAYRPARVVSNDEICTRIDSNDAWIRERSGIATRRFAGPDESVVDMAAAACQQALERAGLTGADVDAVILATVSHPYLQPSAAALVAHRIGAAPAAAMDLSAACAGFCHGVGLASDMIRSGSATRVLVVGAERMSSLVDPTDRSTAFIFGDGAGAVVVGPSQEPGIGPTVWGSDGSRWQTINQRHSVLEAAELGMPYLTMDGPAVFRWAVWQMAPVARKALEAAGVRVDELAAFVPHQANARIVEALAKQIEVPAHVPVALDVADSGNTSAASIPMAMDRMLAEGQAPAGGLALLIGFGSGLVYAAQVVRLPGADQS